MLHRSRPRCSTLLISILIAVLAPALALHASSHREAPAILSTPQVDGTDFYMFRSYEPGREGFVTLIANYNPLQAPYGGPNYFSLDPSAAYDIHITNNGDAEEDLTFRFLVDRVSPMIALDVGEAGSTESVPIPLVNVGPVDDENGTANVNERRLYRLQVIRGNVNSPTSIVDVTNAATGGRLFGSPLDYIGEKSFPNYAAYANNYIHDIQIPDCGNARMFVGPRKEGFAVSLGEVFDLVNLNPLGPIDGEKSDTADFNITSLALEVPIDCLTGQSSVIAGWTASRLPRPRTFDDQVSYDRPANFSGDLVQVSRLANPLVNEVVIGLPDKDRFNASHPRNDGQFLKYVTHPSLAELLEVLFGVTAPNLFPREDLVAVFLTGVDGLNSDGSVGEMMRLNTAIDPRPMAEQDPFGVLGGDTAGFPNGRRPGDDTVDIALRAVMGALVTPDLAPDGRLPYTDGAAQNATQFDNRFPYLQTPLSGTRDD